MDQRQDLPPTYDPNWNKDNTHKTHQGGQHQQYEHPTNIQQQPLYYQPPGYQQQGYYGPGTIYLAPQQQIIAPPPPDNYSVLAWLTCIFCCWPFGLVAIVKSMEVNSAWRQGDYARAESSSSTARKFSYLALGCGIVGYIIFLFFFFSVIIAGSSSHWYHH